MVATQSLGQLGKPLLIGSLIGLVIGFLVFIIWAAHKDWNKEQLRYKEALFLTVAGRAEEVNHDHSESEVAIEVGQYLRGLHTETETQKKMSVQEFAEYSLRFAKLQDTEKIKLEFENSEKYPPLLRKLEKDWRWSYKDWHGIAHNPHDIKLLQSLLDGTGEVPKLNYQYSTNTRDMWLWWFFLTQSMACIGYFIACLDRYRQHNDYGYWYALPWSHPVTYMILLFVMPTMLVLFFFGLTISFSTDTFRSYFSHARKRELEKKSLYARARGDSQSDTHIDDGAQFLTQLRKRLERRDR